MNGSLFLTPLKLSDAPANNQAVLEVLSTLDVIGEPIAKSTYFAADGFAKHVVFAGCSPFLRFEPENENDLNFCHVALHGTFASAQLIYGENTVKPRCPNCRKRLTDWQEKLTQWQQPNAIAQCTNCHHETPATALDWRQHAASGRYFIEFRNVFPGEASPSDLLMAKLKKATLLDWQYAWAGMWPQAQSSAK